MTGASKGSKDDIQKYMVTMLVRKLDVNGDGPGQLQSPKRQDNNDDDRLGRVYVPKGMFRSVWEYIRMFMFSPCFCFVGLAVN